MEESIPVVDFSSFVSENEKKSDLIETSKKINDSITKFGFVYLKNFGICRKKIDSLFDASSSFFSLPTNIKESVARKDDQSNCGYVSLGKESLDPKKFEKKI